jgi:hypothetical protein
MNRVKNALLSGHRPHRLAMAAPPQQLAATASFHSTPPLQRKRKTQWHHVTIPLPIVLLAAPEKKKCSFIRSA